MRILSLANEYFKYIQSLPILLTMERNFGNVKILLSNEQTIVQNVPNSVHLMVLTTHLCLKGELSGLFGLRNFYTLHFNELSLNQNTLCKMGQPMQFLSV